MLETTDVGKFSINTTTGAIVTKQVLDREVQPTYSLLVVARAKDNPDKQTTLHIIIKLIDIDDNRPSFRGCTPGQTYLDPLRVKVRENLLSGQMVSRLTACDADTTPNNNTYFFIICKFYYVINQQSP